MKLKHQLLITVLEDEDEELTDNPVEDYFDGLEGFEIYFINDLYDIIWFKSTGRMLGAFRNAHRITSKIWYGQVLDLESSAPKMQLHCYLNDGTLLTKGMNDISDVSPVDGLQGIKPKYKSLEREAAFIDFKQKEGLILLPNGETIRESEFFEE